MGDGGALAEAAGPPAAERRAGSSCCGATPATRPPAAREEGGSAKSAGDKTSDESDCCGGGGAVAVSTQQRQAMVSDYYGRVISKRDDLLTNACCLGDAMPAHLRPIASKLHGEVVSRYYGCGLCIPDALEGCEVLDLGCGAGRDCFLLSALVGAGGRVVGVDMTEEQLAVAKKHARYHAEALLGASSSNVRFLRGEIERLGELGLPAGGFDAVVSNCVLNLSADKHAVLAGAFRLLKDGGEMYFSDVYTENRRVPAKLLADAQLVGECLAGALYWPDFVALASDVGFRPLRVVEWRKLGVSSAELAERLGDLSFVSATIRLFKLRGAERPAGGDAASVRYLGTLAERPEHFTLDDRNRFAIGQPTRVDADTFAVLRSSRFARYFELGDGA